MKKPLKGIIFPDVLQALIDSGFIKSQTDLVLKLERTVDPKVKGDASRFRVMRRFEKMINGEGKVPSKEYKAAFSQSFENLKICLLHKIPFKYSDYKSKAENYKLVKGFIVAVDNEYLTDDTFALKEYVLNLCEKEKYYFKKPNNKEVINLIEEIFYISENDLEREITQNKYINGKKMNDKIVFHLLKIHQFLHLFSIIEQLIYISFGKELEVIKLQNRNVITDLLPSLNSEGKYIGAVEKLIKKIQYKLGFTTQLELCKSLCIEGVDQESTIKKRINRWKSGSNKITPKAFNDLYQRKYEDYIPEEIILIASLIDITARELIQMNLSKIWVINEYKKYYKYQSNIIETLGTPHLFK